MYTTSEITSRVLDLYFSRTDVYARSFLKSDGTLGYSPSCACSPVCFLGTKCPVWKPQEVTGTIISDHLGATTLLPHPRTLGSYSTSPDQEVKWIVLDIDAHSKTRSSGIVSPLDSIPAYQTVYALSHTLRNLHIPHYVEESGMGFHIWVFTPPLDAEVAHRAGRQIVDMTEECATEVEVFPKQVQIVGFGNLVKIPYGLHWSGRKCVFVDIVSKEYIGDQWEYLMAMQRCEPLQLERLASQRVVSKIGRVTSINHVQATLPPDVRLPGPPCMTAMWKARLYEGQGRNQVLHQMAINLSRAGFLEVTQAKEILAHWNNAQPEPLDAQEFNSAIDHAYSGARYSYGSDRTVISEYCKNNQGCPICDRDNSNSRLYSVIKATRGYNNL